MLRLVSACVALCFGASAAIAETGMLPNGASITWDRLQIVEDEDTGFELPSSPDALRYQLNLPHCQCAKAGAGFQTEILYEVKMSVTTGTTSPGEIWVGTECDNDEVRDMKCRQLVDRTIEDIDTLAVQARDISLPLFDVINAVEPAAACQERTGFAYAWILVDSDGDNTYDYTTNQSVGAGPFTEITGIDTQPPPLPENFGAASGENSINVSWDIPEGRATDLFAYQAFCIDDAGGPVTTTPPAPLYQTTQTVCGIAQEFPLTLTSLPADADETEVAAIPVPFRSLDPSYLCGTQTSGTATSMSIGGLDNNRQYTIAVAAIDYYGNVVGTYFSRTVSPKSVTDLWEDIHDGGGSKIEGGFCSTGDGAGFATMLVVLALALVRRRVVVGAVLAAGLVTTTVARADDFEPYWEDPTSSAVLAADEDRVTWNAGIRLGPYIPDIDAKLQTNGSGQGPYHAMFGDYFDGDDRVSKHVWQVLPMLDVDRILWRGFGQVGVGGSLGYMQKSALAYTESSDPSMGVARERAPGSTIKFRLLPVAATVTYRLTYLDEAWGIPLVPYLRGGLSYYVWWMKAPSGNTSRICDDGSGGAGCAGNKAYGGTLGYQGSVGLAIRAERIDRDAARSMQHSGILHAGFYGELSVAKVDGFGSETRLSVGDATWFAGVNFEF